jgi:hypothetical protein
VHCMVQIFNSSTGQLVSMLSPSLASTSLTLISKNSVGLSHGSSVCTASALTGMLRATMAVGAKRPVVHGLNSMSRQFADKTANESNLTIAALDDARTKGGQGLLYS